MKYFKRLKIYKASNVTFKPESCEAYSYRWWCFVKKINGFVVFNNYSYSVSTRKHQNKVRSLLNELGIKIDLYVELHDGLKSYSGEPALRSAYWNNESKEQIALIKKVFKAKLTQEQIQEVYNAKEESLANAYLNRAFKYDEKKRKIEDEKRLEIHQQKFAKGVQTIVNASTLTVVQS